MGHCSRKPGAERRCFFELKRYVRADRVFSGIAASPSQKRTLFGAFCNSYPLCFESGQLGRHRATSALCHKGTSEQSASAPKKNRNAACVSNATLQEKGEAKYNSTTRCHISFAHCSRAIVSSYGLAMFGPLRG